MKEVSADKFSDTWICIFWNGKWVNYGNMGGPTDWRYFKQYYKDRVKKIEEEQAAKK